MKRREFIRPTSRRPISGAEESTTARTHLLSTFRRQAGILVGVQSVLGESLRLAKSASPLRTE